MNLRPKISLLSRSLRRDFFQNMPVDLPMSVKSDSILFDGKIQKRKRIILLTTGCDVGTCTMCPFPGESSSQVNSQNLKNQFDNAFSGDSIQNYELLTIFCNGNFFSNREISPDVRDYMFSKIKDSITVKTVVVESLPQFIQEETVAEAKKILGDVKLAVFMGLQSSNDLVREVAINTTCTKKSFELAVKHLKSCNYLPITFLMIKPPFLTEDEAIEDTLASIQYLSDIGVSHSTLCPTRVAPNTVLEKIHAAGLYQPPWVWTVVEILKRNADSRGSIPMVNTTELKQEQNSDSVCANSCPKCGPTIISAVEKFLFSRNLEDLNLSACECYQDYLEFKSAETARWAETSIEERIKSFYLG
jgi:radical SAM enzyme (TIGR01210 family)